MLLHKLDDNSDLAAAHRQIVHGGHRLGGLQVFAVFDQGWNVCPTALVCRLCVCAWPKGPTNPTDSALLCAIEAVAEHIRKQGGDASKPFGPPLTIALASCRYPECPCGETVNDG
jgi:hypothetical protein